MSTTINTANCDCDTDQTSISLDQALNQILHEVSAVTEVEIVALRSSLARIVADDIVSPDNIPNHTNSAMDGYAFKAEDLPADGSRTFVLVGASVAGLPYKKKVGSGECVRIMTGAVMPEGVDTVVMQEYVTTNQDQIIISAGSKPGSHVRHAGEDLAQGEVALKNGIRMTPSRLGVVASLGRSELPVYRKPRVAFFSNGDELRSIGEVLTTGEVYDSNRYSLYGLLVSCGVDPIDLGVIGDNQGDITKALKHGAQIADMVITSAGASVGDADYIKPLLDELGEINFWKVAIKPGRPLIFGRIDNSLFFGLPGNPVSVIVTFDLFVRPALRKLSGQQLVHPLRFNVRCIAPLQKRPGRYEFQRGILSLDQQGQYIVCGVGFQGSGMLSSMAMANCYIVLPADAQDVAAGDEVTVQPFATETIC